MGFTADLSIPVLTVFLQGLLSFFSPCVLPMLPLYSNVYFDFYPRVLQDYDISSNVAWSKAIVGAYLGDVEDEVEEAGMPAPEEDVELVG